MPYNPHPSEKLRKLFLEKPWQGNDPMKASFLFVGLDANYHKKIEEKNPKKIFDEILNYHTDGVGYWKKKKVHHPFMLDGYNGDGKRYHKTFARIGFTPKDAELVSFIELLDLPTTGGSKLKPSDLSQCHLDTLVNIFDCGSAKYIFLVGRGVANLMGQREEFTRFFQGPLRKDGDLSVFREHNGQTLYGIYHFSCHWPKHVCVLENQIAQISEIRQKFVGG